jgi:hypothetical protein
VLVEELVQGLEKPQGEAIKAKNQELVAFIK